MDRRGFIAAGLALAGAACSKRGKAKLNTPPGELSFTGHALGHRLRDGNLPRATDKRRAKVVIVGAGMSGLSAAWRLQRAGFNDFELLELESSPGGNARWGENNVSAYPLGAHYIPLPTKEARAARWMLADLGILQGDADAKLPRYDERALCQAPQERLYRNGQWVEGLAPIDGISAEDRAEWQRFEARMREFQAKKGRDGRRAFAIPLEFSSRDPDLLVLDRLTMAAWLQAEGFVSEAVHWVVDYACRDDYGCDYRRVSAWAGIHYFACRDSAFSHDSEQEAVLTWPSGNGHVVKRLLEQGRFRVTPNALVHRVEARKQDVTIEVFLAQESRSVEITAEQVIWAAPFGFAARALANDADLKEALAARDYAPWLTANLTLSELPHVHHGAPLSWDNVIHDSASLGYVVATHQGVRTLPGPTVLTWYFPLAAVSPLEGRRKLMTLSRERWAEAALMDLERPHPEIRNITTRIDVFGNGHAMAVPEPGLIWGEQRRNILARKGRLHFAHSDASGLSLFEEANDGGVMAAETVLAAYGVRSDTLRFRRG